MSQEICPEYNEQASIANFSDDDFIIKNESYSLSIDKSYENNIIEDNVISEIPLSENKVYKTYVYEDFILKVASGNNTIFSIEIKTDKFHTNRNVKIGDKRDEVVKAYGERKEYFDDINYVYNNKTLFFYFDEQDQVTKIVLEMI